jgi:excinuclease ABC subunit C
MDIPGVGDRSVRKLLRQFGSVQRVRTASDEALAEVVGPAVARRVRVYFEEGASRSPAGGAPPTAEGA